jgi:asparagine synthase (glutamine-hydrolysing)
MQLILKSLYMGMFSENDVYLHEYNKHKTLFQENSATKSVDLSQFDASKPNQMLYHSIFTTSLPTLLHYEDRNSMAFSLESRVPFLDHRLVEFAFGLPFDQKVSNDAETKHILRKALKDVLPDSIANRQDKKGFVTPGEIEWLNGPLKFLFSEMDYNQFDWLSKKEIKKLLDEYQKGDLKNANLVWRLLSDNYWLKYIH